MKELKRIFKVYLAINLIVFSFSYINAIEKDITVKIIDDFENIKSWSSFAANGVKLKLASTSGKKGKSLGLDFDFSKTKGYVAIFKKDSIILPDDYKFTFYIKGDAPENTLEFKLIDNNGNTFWKTFQEFSFSSTWEKVTIKKHHIAFAWGPAGGGAIKNVHKIEIVISCGKKGGKGSVMIDELSLIDLSNIKTKFNMKAKASTEEKSEFSAHKAIDGNMSTRWSSIFADNQWLELDIGSIQEFVGIDIIWETAYAKKYDILISKNGLEWNKVFSIKNSDGGTDSIYFGKHSARYIKIDAKKRATEWGNSILEIKLKGAEDEIRLTSSSTNQGKAINAMDGNKDTAWNSKKGEEEWLLLDLNRGRDLGGIFIYWDENYAKNYDIFFSSDKKEWSKKYSTKRGNGKRDRIFFKEIEARYIKIQCNKSANDKGYGIKEIELRDYREAGDQNKLYEIVSEDAPKGYYPKYFLGTHTYWTIIGVCEDEKESLFNEEGQFETEKENFSIEPFLYIDEKLITWADVKLSQFLERGYLPIPEVIWDYEGLKLSIKIFAQGNPGASFIYAIYRVENNSNQTREGKLYLTIRPFQVNPPWQKLNMKGGVAKIKKIDYTSNIIKVNDNKKIFPVIKPDKFGAIPFLKGDIIDYLEYGKLPIDEKIIDNNGYASGALEYNFKLKQGEKSEYYLIVPFHKKDPDVECNLKPEEAKQIVYKKMDEVINIWENKLSKVIFKVPEKGKNFINTLKANLAYVFINKDGPRIQPGSRSYLRSWIRDGSMTSSALLRMGNIKEVKEYLNWYSPNLFPDGRVPCVVDHRGPDPCAENDSNGEFIFAFLQYYHFTKDKKFIEKHFKQIKRAADFIIKMRNERKTSKYKDGPDKKKVLYGLVTESISHEGYSAKPVHSYWDDFFSLKGLKDMVEICKILNKSDLIKNYEHEVKDFRQDLYNSIKLCMQIHNIDYIPGAAELGDFDSTSTAIGIFPCGEYEYMPQPALNNTFNRYYKDFLKRLIPNNNWGSGYTPYEVRSCQAFIYMKKKDRALKMFDFFFEDQRPSNWNHWSEVVWTDSNAGKWLGDMPHTWIGSGFINAVRSMFVYERESDKSLVLSAGIPEDWLDNQQEVGIENALTYYGILNYSMKKIDNKIFVEIWGDMDIPGKIIFTSPISKNIMNVKINGIKRKKFLNNEIIFKHLPAKLEISYFK